jgi:hypothetical protein
VLGELDSRISPVVVVCPKPLFETYRLPSGPNVEIREVIPPVYGPASGTCGH